MNRFLKNTVFFLIPILFGTLILEISFRNIDTSYRIKNTQFNKVKKNVEAIILGSSHTFEGVDPTYLSYEAYNLANSGQDLYTDLQLLKSFINETENLKVVVVPISYHSLFAGFTASSINYQRAYFYTDEYGIRPDFHIPLDPKRVSYIARFRLDKGMSMLFNNNIKHEITEKGYRKTLHNPKQLNPIDNHTSVKMNIDQYHTNMKMERLQINIAYLNEIIGILKEENIEILFTTTPTYKTYHENLKEEYLGVMDNVIDSLCLKHGIEYLNAMTDNEFKVSDFRNANHLSKSGAKKFTIILDQSIKELNTTKNKRH